MTSIWHLSTEGCDTSVLQSEPSAWTYYIPSNATSPSFDQLKNHTLESKQKITKDSPTSVQNLVVSQQQKNVNHIEITLFGKRDQNFGKSLKNHPWHWRLEKILAHLTNIRSQIGPIFVEIDPLNSSHFSRSLWSSPVIKVDSEFSIIPLQAYSLSTVEVSIRQLTNYFADLNKQGYAFLKELGGGIIWWSLLPLPGSRPNDEKNKKIILLLACFPWLWKKCKTELFDESKLCFVLWQL